MTGIVIDAAAVVDLICGFPAADPYRGVIEAATSVAAPAHLDADVLSALARLMRAGRLSRPQERVELLATFGARRWPLQPLILPAWALLERIAARDALYVALAASLDATLVTTDGRLRRAARGLVAVAQPVE
ncbi:MAG: type II toxin-antitoxin system VapC family toxin [Marmoricola sp.]